MPRLTSVSDLEDLRKQILDQRDPNRVSVAVCSGPGCLAYASETLKSERVYTLPR